MAARVALATVRDGLAAGETSVERVTLVVFAADSYELRASARWRSLRRSHQLSDL